MLNEFVWTPWLSVILVAVATLGVVTIFLRLRRRSQSLSIDELCSHLLPLGEQLADVKTELERARRYERSLSVAVLALEGADGPLGSSPRVGRRGNRALGESERSNQLAFIISGYMIRQTLRNTDLIAYDSAADRYLICLPELNQSEAEQTIQRVTELVLKRTGVKLRSGWAEFPVDGLTLDDLISRADGMMDRLPVPRRSVGGAVTASVHQMG